MQHSRRRFSRVADSSSPKGPDGEFGHGCTPMHTDRKTRKELGLKLATVVFPRAT
jgi:hypothetical protein